MKKFLEVIEENPELKGKLQALGEKPAVSDIIALAAQYGMTLTEADFAAPKGELSEDELEAVAGGSGEGDCLIWGDINPNVWWR